MDANIVTWDYSALAESHALDRPSDELLSKSKGS